MSTRTCATSMPVAPVTTASNEGYVAVFSTRLDF
jgi:hypothetical protein